MTSSAQKSHVLKRHSALARAAVVQFRWPPLARAASGDGTARVARRMLAKHVVLAWTAHHAHENTPIPNQREHLK